MKALLESRSRFLGGVLISLGLALPALQPLAAHAATPTISATVLNHSTIQVSGFGFGPGDKVEIVDSLGGRVFTTATKIVILPPPPTCTPLHPCLTTPVFLAGRIHATLPKHVVQCVFEVVRVRAYDLNRRLASNTVRVILGFGLCK